MKLLSMFKKKDKMPTCSAVVVAAGSSQRMGSDKLMMKLGKTPVIMHTLLTFQHSPYIDEIIVVTRMDLVMPVAAMCRQYGVTKVKKVICGGKTRAESSLCGVCEVKPSAKLIAIHDGARPLVTHELIEKTVKTAAEYCAAVPALSITDTLKAVDGEYVTDTLDRDGYCTVQTPQVFDADIIKGALTFAVKKKIAVTDDCAAVEHMGFTPKTVPGDDTNIKLTVPADLKKAEWILRERAAFFENGAWL